jgi:hypothetical protein
MSRTYLPTTRQIQECFVQELAQVDGTVVDTYDDGQHLYLRAVLPQLREVLPGDQLQAGVALKAVGNEVLVHPYVFRQVCRNGAIVAQAIETRRLQRVPTPADEMAVAETLAELHEAVQACSAEEAFLCAMDQIRLTTQRPADLNVLMIAILPNWPPHTRSYVIEQITRRQSADGDASQFGLMNAVTALARDTPDPLMRWRLEELGGAIGAFLLPRRQPDDSGAAVCVRAGM